LIERTRRSSLKCAPVKSARTPLRIVLGAAIGAVAAAAPGCLAESLGPTPTVDAGAFDAGKPNAIRFDASSADAPTSPVDASVKDAAPAPEDDAAIDATADVAADVTVDAARDAASIGRFVIGPLSGTTSELGRTATFTVGLSRAPVADVTLALTSSAPGEGTAAPSSLVFTPADWATRTVTVTGVADDVDDGDVPFAIVFQPTSSADADYAGVVPPSIPVTNVGAIDVLKNGGFELAAGIDFDDPASFPPAWAASGGWQGAPNPPFHAQILAAAARTGALGVKIARQVGTDGTHLPGIEQAVAIAPAQIGRAFRLRGFARALSPTSPVRFLLAADTAVGTHLAIDYVDTAADGAWTPLSVTVTAPAGTDHLKASIIAPSMTYFGESYADDLRLEYTDH
jgi:hypothetical protein